MFEYVFLLFAVVQDEICLQVMREGTVCGIMIMRVDLHVIMNVLDNNIFFSLVKFCWSSILYD